MDSAFSSPEPDIGALRDQMIVDLAYYRMKRRQAAAAPETAQFVSTWDMLIARMNSHIARLGPAQ